MIRTLAALVTGALALSLIAFAAPAGAHDDIARRLLQSCVGCKLPKDLRGQDLHGIRFVGDDLRDVDFSHANLQDAEFTGDELDRTHFDQADLRNVRFVGVHMHAATFAGARTDGVRFVGISLDRDDVSPDVARLILHDCTGCSLEKIDLHGQDLRGIRIIGANLRDADLSHADLRGSRLIGANLRDARLTGATVGDAIICAPNRGDDDDSSRTACANLRGVDLHGVDLRGARWCDDHDDAVPAQCRPVTRDELVHDAHADLTGALSP
jgi:uncharacterized protein YjbI with pentapeptide repeats